MQRRAPRWAALNYFLKESRLWYPLSAMVPRSLRPAVRKLAFQPARALKLDAKDRRFLVDYYAEDVRKLGILLDHDLSEWLR